MTLPPPPTLDVLLRSAIDAPARPGGYRPRHARTRRQPRWARLWRALTGRGIPG